MEDHKRKRRISQEPASWCFLQCCSASHSCPSSWKRSENILLEGHRPSICHCWIFSHKPVAFFLTDEPTSQDLWRNCFLRAFLHCTNSDLIGEWQVSVANGVNLTRIFFFINGKDQLQGKVQPQIGVFNETGLQRFDLILSMCNRYGIRAILAMVNFEDWMGESCPLTCSVTHCALE